MLQRVVLGQVRFNLPGLLADARGVVTGRQLVARFAAIDRLVGFLRVLSAEQSIDDLQPGLRIVYARGGAGTREAIVLMPVGSPGLADVVAHAARLAGGQTFTGTGKQFVQYRDAEGKLKLRRDHVITLPDGSKALNVRYQPPSQSILQDWDGDGLLDLIMNPGQTMNTGPAVLRNIGTKTAPKFDHPKRLACYGEELNGITKHGPYLGVGDMDGDGRSDLIASTEVGSYVFFRRTALDMDKAPTTKVGEVRIEP